MAPLRTIASVSSVYFLVQSIVWAVLGLLGILAYSCHFTPTVGTQVDLSFSSLARIYFTDPSCWAGGKTFTTTSGAQIVTLASLQFVFNLLLAIVSLILLFVIPRGSNYTFLLWLYNMIFLVIAVSVVDLVASTTFSSDKDSISPAILEAPRIALTNMLMILSLVAARGYLYWAVNIILVFYLLLTATMRILKAFKKLDEPKDQVGNTNRGFELDQQTFPKHSAKARWPKLGSPDWRRRLNDSPNRDNVYQKDRTGFGRREPLDHQNNTRDYEYTSHQNNLPRTTPVDYRRNGYYNDRGRDSPDERRLQAEIWDNARQRDNYERQRPEPPVPRPNSLHEAILTLKPLRQVRPKLPEMQTKY